jgi:uncharacterized delta-60 repeat protein
MNAILPILLIALISVSQALANLPGVLDSSFKTGGGANGTVNVVKRLKDGKILIAGTFTTVQGVPRNRIARLLASGKVDLTFNPGSGADGDVLALAVQADGKVLIGGQFSSYNGTGRDGIARLNADGSLDSSFNPGSGTNNFVSALAVQADGKVLIGGFFSSYNGTERNRIARLNADGTLDGSFDPGTGADGGVFALAVQADGKVLIGGGFSSYNGTERNRIARLNADGGLDDSFDPGTGADGGVFALAVQADGKVLIGGFFTSYNSTERNNIARLNANGSLDSSFDPGTGADGTVRALAVQADGKVLIGGLFTSYNDTGRNRIARLNANGSLDSSFDLGTGADGGVRALAVQADGKVLIGGFFTSYNGTGRNRIALLNANGSLDSSFDPGSGADGSVVALAVQADGKVLIGGFFTSYSGTGRNRIARLNADGSLDSSFNPGTGANDYVFALAVQADGKVLIVGGFSSYNGTERNGIARLNADGSLDTNFKPESGVNGNVFALAVQADGKVLIGGSFTSYNGTGRNGIARLNADGSLDTNFNPGTGVDGDVSALAVQADGKVLIGGSFTSYNDTERNNIARLNAAGTLDGSFDPRSGADGQVSTLAVQADGKVLIGGFFSSYNGTARNNIARLNADGTLDGSFDPGSGANSYVFALAVQADGKVLIGGEFTNYNGTGRTSIARLNADGSLDSSFNPGTGAENGVNGLAVQADGKVLIGGGFTSYDGQTAYGVARVNLGYTLAATTFTGITSSSNTANAPLFGRVTVSVSKTRSFTGSLTLGAESLKFAEVFDYSGQAYVTLKKKDGGFLSLRLALTRGSSGGAVLVGDVRNFLGRVAELEAHAPFFSSSRLPANHFTGLYNLSLSGGPVLGTAVVSGAGFLTCTVSSSGKVSVAGKLPDGTALSTAVNLTQDGELLLHFPLYKGKGLLQGIPQIDDSDLSAQKPRPVSGPDFLWQRPADSSYPSGINQPLSVDGSQYLAKSSTLPPFGDASANNVTVTLEGGLNNPGSAPTSTLKFKTSGAVDGAVTGSINSLVISVNRSKGTFSGSFVPTASTTKVPFSGVLTDRLSGRGFAIMRNVSGAPVPTMITLSTFNP